MINQDIKKVTVGAEINPDTLRYFQGGAKLFGVNLSQFFSMIIYRRNAEGFVFYDVSPEYGQIAKTSKQTILHISEEYKALLQEWADKNGTSVTGVMRCLIYGAVKKMIEYDRYVNENRARLMDGAEDVEKVRIIDECERHGVSVSELIDEVLALCRTNSIRKVFDISQPLKPTLFDYKFMLSEKQKKRMQSICTRQKLDVEVVKSFVELSVLVHFIETVPKNCHVSKRQFLALKNICQDIGLTPSKLLDDYVDLLITEEYHTPELAEDEELLRINAIMLQKTHDFIEKFCERKRIKFSEGVRLQVNFIYNYFDKNGIQIPAKYVF